MILHFFHGWGFDARVWEDVAALLPEYPAEFVDRGYFGEPAIPPPGEPAIAVTHSFGTMLALAEAPGRYRGIVAINGFDCFTVRDGFPGVARRVLDRMLASYAADPAAVVASFRARCGAGMATGDLRADCLRDDLVALRDEDRRERAAAFAGPILSLQGGADPILPPAMRDAVFASAGRVDRVLIAEAGHLLPLVEPGLCAMHIKRFVERTR